MLWVVVLFLYNVMPHLLSRRDVHGALPLHYVCQRWSPEAAFYAETLMRMHPASRYAQDNRGNTPSPPSPPSY